MSGDQFGERLPYLIADDAVTLDEELREQRLHDQPAVLVGHPPVKGHGIVQEHQGGFDQLRARSEVTVNVLKVVLKSCPLG